VAGEREPPAGQTPGEAAPRDDTRARILAAAMEAFARDGFDATSVRSIARRCGISDAGVFYYFPTKRHLLEALWNEAPAGSFPVGDPAAPLTAEQLAELVRATIHISAENFTYLRLVARQALASDETAIALRNASRARWRTALARHFQAAGPRAAELVETFAAAVTGYLLRLEMETGDAYPEAVRDDAFQERVIRAVQRLLPVERAESPAAG
jgi:AcrR family transcriptional regulator